MSFEPKTDMVEQIAGFEAALKEAYEKGVQDGIERIVAAARGPLPQAAEENKTTSMIAEAAEERISRHVARRAPRGLVPKVVGRMLQEHPGKIIAEYEEIVSQYDERVSEKSVGNELRRHEGAKYRRNDSSEWFPISGNNEAEDAADNEQSPASDQTNQGESAWSRLSQ